MLRLPDFLAIDTTHLWLKLSLAEQEKAWQLQKSYSNPITRHNAYLNSVCLYEFLNWLQDWLQEQYNLQASIFPSEQGLAQIWEFFNGAAIQFGDTRIVLVPTEILDLDVLCIPQEWVDIQSWAADYYIGVQVNLDDDEDCWMRVYGFTTHRQVKNQGVYDVDCRTYSLPIDTLADDIASLFATLELNFKVEVPSEIHLSDVEATNLLHILGSTSVYNPRLFNIPFAKWAALLSNPKWCEQLYNQRLGLFQNTTPCYPSNQSPSTVHLGSWFENFFTQGWQSLDALVEAQTLNLAFECRSSDTQGISLKGAKILDLGIQISGKSIALLLAVSQETEEKTAIIAQVHPTGNDSYLPSNLKISLLESGNVLQEIQSRSRDCYIQLNRFKVLAGANFSIKLALGEFSITENFVI